jgi:membrane protein DedA with SNARE-associated domain
MLEWIVGTLDRLGYGGVALLMFLENIFPPLPSEVIMPLAGFTSASGRLSLLGVALAGTIGATLGQLPLYAVGRAVGEERLERWAEKHGAWLTVSGDDIRRAKEWFEKHGSKAILICRVVPGVRSLISLPAGVQRMPLPKFLALTAIGSGIWVSALAAIGARLGEHHDLVQRYLGPAGTVVFALIGLTWLVRGIRLKRERRAA